MRERCTRTSTASCPLRSGRRSRLTSRTARRVARTSPKSGPCANGPPRCWDLLGRPSVRRRPWSSYGVSPNVRPGMCADHSHGRPRSRWHWESATTSETPSRRWHQPTRQRRSLDYTIVRPHRPGPCRRRHRLVVGLPGLTTRKIRRSPGSDGTVVVEQALDASTVIQIFQRAASAGSLSDSTSYGFTGGFERARANRLARFVGRLRVEITGPLSADSLNRLLEQVAPLP